ncbi:hypothetical protein FQN60_004329 [Etheostoma spectabile]|uniref:Uncharacterized protein n=1 Tax=Etheostoma spectabile TaxID=54343 RepID=A0A5J5CZC5_9PERO|nr:hypothetical protein FQN60_004329 [Etheostoma spectabile]
MDEAAGRRAVVSGVSSRSQHKQARSALPFIPGCHLRQTPFGIVTFRWADALGCFKRRVPLAQNQHGLVLVVLRISGDGLVAFDQPELLHEHGQVEREGVRWRVKVPAHSLEQQVRSVAQQRVPIVAQRCETGIGVNGVGSSGGRVEESPGSPPTLPPSLRSSSGDAAAAIAR